jgi:uncharacterized protein YcbK (DUF882 family)
VPVSIARLVPIASTSRRTGYCCGLAALLVLFTGEDLQKATANGDTRTISFHHIHTGEDLTITYKKNGRYDEDALKKINWALRDWRRDEPTRMDPQLIDLIWEVHREVGATEPIHVIGGYRAPATNAMLRRRSRGVAKFSLHMAGKAMDFFIPGVSLEAVRNAGLRLQRGGVGFYPSSGSPFVHMDTGSVRHWPRVPHDVLARVMATKPKVQVAAVDQRPKPGFLARMFRPSRDAEEEADEATVAPPTNNAPAAAQQRTATVAAIVPKPHLAAAPIAMAVPVPRTKPAPKPATFQVAATATRPVALARPAQAASLVARAQTPNEIIDARGFWQGLPVIEPDHPKAAARTPDPQATASIPPWPITDREQPDRKPPDAALAYAPQTAPVTVRAQPMGALPRIAAQIPNDTTVALKRRSGLPTVVAHALPPLASAAPAPRVGDVNDDPWMRAMVMSPSASDFMRTTLFGVPDFRDLAAQLHKPATSVMMTFSFDPHLGMRPDRFTGTAVVFVSTVTFMGRTAMLR